MTYLPSIFELAKLDYEPVTHGYKKSEKAMLERAVAQLGSVDYQIGVCAQNLTYICRPKRDVRFEVK